MMPYIATMESIRQNDSEVRQGTEGSFTIYKCGCELKIKEVMHDLAAIDWCLCVYHQGYDDAIEECRA